MPYISPKDRLRFTDAINKLAGEIKTDGELNYVITRLAIYFCANKGDNYEACARTISALECAKLEFYRRKVGPYEDFKVGANGDVY